MGFPHTANQAARPSGVAVIAFAFLLASVYLLTAGGLMLLRPGLVGIAAGAVLLGGLEVAGPYMFLLIAALGLAISRGLFHLHNWARRVATLVAIGGIVLLIPRISGDVVSLRVGRLAWAALQMMVRVLIVFYLHQSPVREAFEASRPQSSHWKMCKLFVFTPAKRGRNGRL
jgi:hypothetical protein